MEKKQISRKYQYDPLNRLLSVSVNDDYTRVYTYDPAGNRISVTDTGTTMPGVSVTRTRPAELRQQTTPLPRVPGAQHVCGNCGAPVAAGRKFCSGCGTPVSSTVPTATGSPAASLTPSVCPGCGSPVKPGIKFCGDCGRPLE